jgi:hypothetical protein
MLTDFILPTRLPPLPAAPLLQRERMRELFQAGCRMEYMFWDGAHSRQQWPV